MELGYVEIHLTDHCNLNCVGCSHFSNIAKPYFKNYIEFVAEMTELSEKFDVKVLRLMGGEPLLHPDCMKFCSTARSIFPHAQIVLVTNGILLNKVDVNLLNENNIVVCLSNYNLNLNTPQFFGIKNTQTHYKSELYNISLDLDGKQDREEAFRNCDLHTHHWNFYKDGRLYACCVAPNIHIFLEHFGIEWQYKEDEIGISVFDHTPEEILEFLNNSTPLCRYCNTIARSKSKVRHCKSKGEIEEWTC